jgi:hypothetical protein
VDGLGAASIFGADVGAVADQALDYLFLIGGCGDMQRGIAGMNVVSDLMQIVRMR